MPRVRSVTTLAASVTLLLLSCGAPKAPKGATEVLPFIEDDYGKAVAEAKARKLPLFVDVWAPW